MLSFDGTGGRVTVEKSRSAMSADVIACASSRVGTSLRCFSANSFTGARSASSRALVGVDVNALLAQGRAFVERDAVPAVVVVFGAQCFVDVDLAA